MTFFSSFFSILFLCSFEIFGGKFDKAYKKIKLFATQRNLIGSGILSLTRLTTYYYLYMNRDWKPQICNDNLISVLSIPVSLFNYIYITRWSGLIILSKRTRDEHIAIACMCLSRCRSRWSSFHSCAHFQQCCDSTTITV